VPCFSGRSFSSLREKALICEVLRYYFFMIRVGVLICFLLGIFFVFVFFMCLYFIFLNVRYFLLCIFVVSFCT
jgi:hypothetical protein